MVRILLAKHISWIVFVAMLPVDIEERLLVCGWLGLVDVLLWGSEGQLEGFRTMFVAAGVISLVGKCCLSSHLYNANKLYSTI